MSETSHKRKLSRQTAAVAAAVALASLAAGAAWAQSFSVPTMMSFTRGTVLTGNVGRVSNTVMLRSRDDYDSVFAMIREETRIITAEAEDLRNYNDAAQAELEASQSKVETLRVSHDDARRARERMRRSLAERQDNAKERLQKAENEITTTEMLREQAMDEGASVEEWEAKVERLRARRDQLRELLERVSLLNDRLG